MQTTNSAMTSALRQRLEGEDDRVKRCNSLFDLETDRLLQHNQLTGKLSPEWKRSQYKICGSFVDVKKGEPAMGSKLSLMSSAMTNNMQRGMPANPNSNFEDHSVEQVVEFNDEMLKTREGNNSNSHTMSGLSGLSQFQNLGSMGNLLPNVNMGHENMDFAASSNNLLQGMLKRQSMADFEKSLQYFSPGNMNMNMQNLINSSNNTLLNSFLSPNNSLSNIFQPEGMNMNNLHLMQNFNNDRIDSPASHSTDDSHPMNMNGMKRKLSRRGFEGLNQKSKKRGKWSEYEDKVLQDLANAFLERSEKINFKKIAEHLPGRSAKQCREHWLSTLNPDLKKGRWTKGEEIQLLDLMIAHGKSWSIIAKQIPGRAEHSVKAKGRLMLGERLKTIPPDGANYEGSEEQKQKLYDLHQQLGAEFEEISKNSGYVVSPAKIERTMLSMCKCPSCLELLEDIKKTNSSNLLQGWTKVKAKVIRDLLMKKSNKYATADQLFGVMDEIESTPKASGSKARASSSNSTRLGSFSKLSQFNAQSSSSMLGKVEPEDEEHQLSVSIL